MHDDAPADFLYKIVAAADWRAAQSAGLVGWSEDDRRDGFMHLSTRAQVLETARRRFGGRSDLVALEIDADEIAATVKFEPSHGGELFPHLYGSLSAQSVLRARALVLSKSGDFYFLDQGATR